MKTTVREPLNNTTRTTINLMALIATVGIAVAFFTKFITFTQAVEAGGSVFGAMFLMFIFLTPWD